MYKRSLQKTLEERFYKGKILMILGARQVGKTTLARATIRKMAKEKEILEINGDDPSQRALLENKDRDFLVQLLGEKKVLFIDEAQKVSTIGQSLKLMIDVLGKEKQIIVTGSSSINLLDKTSEPLTGRKRVSMLYPISLQELIAATSEHHIQQQLEQLLIYGSYPSVLNTKDFQQKIEVLQEIVSGYLYRDILEFQDIKNPQLLQKLLKALALQIGGLVSYTELSSLLGIDKNTVEKYIDLLEKSFVIKRIGPLTTKKRREVSKLPKIYFYDLGIRNAVINNFNVLEDRNDTGQMWENMVIMERIKHLSYTRQFTNNYFWRTYDGSEVDWVEERDGKLLGYEIKWNTKKKAKIPGKWEKYPNSEFKVVTPENLKGFLF
jgi:uncharacterized protein